MKDLISKEQFLLRQPAYPQTTLTDPYYYRVANRLASIIANEGLLRGWPEQLQVRVALGLTGYLQDILTDAGLWRSFTAECRVLYGSWLPYYAIDDDYIPHELNELDVRFLIWYTLCMNSDDRRLTDPADQEIAAAARRLHAELDNIYEDPDAPMPEDYHISKGLELNNPAEADEVFHFGNWLFMHSYLLTPAYAMTISEMMASPAIRDDKSMESLRKALEESMMEDPTGPLALYLREWLFLIIEGKMPPAPKMKGEGREGEAPEHPYYTRFMSATGGVPIRYFRTYDELNRFFIDALGWSNEENLPQLKSHRDFVLLVNREKGMLAARDVARCIKLPDNPYYDESYAREHAIDLLTVRGLCPGDLLRYVLERNGLPDAAFPGSEHRLSVADADFTARCYLQQYYRGD
ncbi:MAG: DUF3843 family protein [Muribaculaceae bacterium]|nr:DUF3843 family protein [Muribaculaceae bacterium]